MKSINISKDGNYIFTVDSADERTIYAFSAKTGNKVGSAKVGRDIVYDMDCNASNSVAVSMKRGIKLYNFDG